MIESRCPNAEQRPIPTPLSLPPSLPPYLDQGHQFGQCPSLRVLGMLPVEVGNVTVHWLPSHLELVRCLLVLHLLFFISLIFW